MYGLNDDFQDLKKENERLRAENAELRARLERYEKAAQRIIDLANDDRAVSIGVRIDESAREMYGTIEPDVADQLDQIEKTAQQILPEPPKEPDHAA